MAVVWVIVLAPQLDTTYGGNEQLFVEIVAGIATWTGWVIPLLVAMEAGAPRKPRPARGVGAHRSRVEAVLDTLIHRDHLLSVSGCDDAGGGAPR